MDPAAKCDQPAFEENAPPAILTEKRRRTPSWAAAHTALLRRTSATLHHWDGIFQRRASGSNCPRDTRIRCPEGSCTHLITGKASWPGILFKLGARSPQRVEKKFHGLIARALKSIPADGASRDH